MEQPSLVNLRHQIDALPWWHAIDFGNGIVSPGRLKRSSIERTSNIVFGRVAVEGRSVLDVGCWDGAFSIEAARRGALRVLATDHYAWHNDGDRRAFELARANLAPSIEVMDIDLPDLSLDRIGAFDIVLFLGVFYHLRHPLEVLERVSRLATECLVIQSRLLRTLTHRPLMRFCPGSELDGDPSNWWAPNRACLEAMLYDLGFCDIKFKHPDRCMRYGIFHAFRKRTAPYKSAK